MDQPSTSLDNSRFDIVPVRARHDGWTPARQQAFIAALAETACVAEATAAVGMTPKSAYRLRARPEAAAFRQAWAVALDFAVQRVAEAAIGRALTGTVRPVCFAGEQVGERRYFDERLTMFILRTRDPVRFGAWRDRYDARQHSDGPGRLLGIALEELGDGGVGGSGVGDTTACAIAMAADSDPSVPPALLGDPADASCRDRDPADDWLSTERVLRPRPRPPSRHDVA